MYRLLYVAYYNNVNAIMSYYNVNLCIFPHGENTENNLSKPHVVITKALVRISSAMHELVLL